MTQRMPNEHIVPSNNTCHITPNMFMFKSGSSVTLCSDVLRYQHSRGLWCDFTLKEAESSSETLVSYCYVMLASQPRRHQPEPSLLWKLQISHIYAAWLQSHVWTDTSIKFHSESLG